MSKKINKTKEQTLLSFGRSPLKRATFKTKLGFTLFELLVSLSIIAVLTAVAVVSFGGLNKKTRDTRRVSDLEKIRVALESAKQVGNSYPAAVGNITNLTGFLDKWPSDPKTNGVGFSNYRYVVGSSGSSYYVCAMVELPASISSGIGTSCSSGWLLQTGLGFTGYYMVTQP